MERDGHSEPFENGQAVRVDNANVEIFVAPYPPLMEGSVDLYVTDRTTGKPIGGSLNIVFDMYMPHGSIKVEAQPTGDGHFLIPYKLFMPGEWRADVTVAGTSDPFALIFNVQ